MVLYTSSRQQRGAGRIRVGMEENKANYSYSANDNMCFVSSQQQLGALWYGVAAWRTFGGQSPSRAQYLRLVNARTALPPEYLVSPRSILYRPVYISPIRHTKHRQRSTGYCVATTDSPY